MRTFSRRDSLELQHEGALSYLRQAIVARIANDARRPPLKLIPSGNRAAPVAVGEAVGRDEVERYDRALRRLVSVEREAIIARVELGYNYHDVADAIGCSTADEARRLVITGLLHLAEEMYRGA